MANLVLTQKPGSGYDDVRGVRYHFPKTYLKQVKQGLGDYFVYYEPRREDGREAYVGWGQAGELEEDSERPGHFYLHVVHGTYQDFPHPVPFRDGHESALFKADRSTNKGAFGRAVRVLPSEEFLRIVRAGFRDELLRPDEAAPDSGLLFVSEPPPILGSREVVKALTERTLRDSAFRRQIRDAYGGQCALTGLKVENGGGWLEMEAAHIQPVKDRGPDSTQNGLALSRTVHALFDRGFIALSDDLEVLVSRTHPLPEKLAALLLPRALVPESSVHRPHPSFLRFHREHYFKDRAA